MRADEQTTFGKNKITMSVEPNNLHLAYERTREVTKRPVQGGAMH